MTNYLLQDRGIKHARIHTGFPRFTDFGQIFRITRKRPKRVLGMEKIQNISCPRTPLEDTYFGNQVPFFLHPRLLRYKESNVGTASTAWIRREYSKERKAQLKTKSV